MIRWLGAFAVGVVVLTATGDARAEFRNDVFDPGHTSIGVTVHPLGYPARFGLVPDVRGRFADDEAVPAVRGVAMEVDAASLFSKNEARDEPARGADFRAVADHPSLVPAAIAATPTGPRSGDPTPRGVTRELTFDLDKAGRFPFDPSGGDGPPQVGGVSARSSIDRGEVDISCAVERIVAFEAVRQEG
ncbi:MAG: YceI family protein [Alphaproteobacteria bacterium]